MFCKECGNEINDKAVICTKCGCATGNPTPITKASFGNIPNKKHTGFGFHSSGRASRQTFWLQNIAIWGIFIVLTIIFLTIIGGAAGSDSITEDDMAGIFVLGIIFFCIFTIAASIYSLMLSIRRIHDFGSSGFLVLLQFIPYIGFIAWIVFGCIPSEERANQYGSEPDVI